MVKRQIIKIDEDKCNGCGQCVPACKEGALQIIGGKAKLVSEIYCDGLGACLGECPTGALTIEERDADEFDEAAVEGHLEKTKAEGKHSDKLPCGCPGTMTKTLKSEGKDKVKAENKASSEKQVSELNQWPIQLMLIPVGAPYLKHADLVLLADCTAVAYANLHHDFIRGRVIAMACPKLDDTNFYVQKLAEMMKVNDFRSIEVVMMEVPCCGGFLQIAKDAAELAGSDMKIRDTVVSLEGEIITKVTS